jgi:L-amino acid N-acyltransferase YncA
MNIEFVNASLVDLSKIVDTYNSTIPSRVVTADLEPVSVESKIGWFNSHNHHSRPLWLIMHDSNYAGWMSFNSFYGRPAYNGCVEVSIYIEENFRSKGLGKICLQKAIHYCSEINIHTLLGFIFAHNETSLKLFYNFQFQKWAHFPEVANMDGTMRDLIILGKKII